MWREGKEREDWVDQEELWDEEDERYLARTNPRRRRRNYPPLSSVERSSFLLSDSQAALDQLARVQQASPPSSPEESPEESLHELLLRHFLHLPANQSAEEAEAEAKAAEEAAEEKTWVYANLLRHMHGAPTQEKPASTDAASPGASPSSPEEDDIYARIVRHFHHQPQKDDNSTEEDGEEGPVHPHIYLWRYFHGFPPAPEASPGSSPQSPSEPMHPHVYFWRYFHGPPLDGNDSLGITTTKTNAIEVDSVDPDTYPQGQLVEPFPDPTNSRREQEGAVHPHARYLRPPPGRYDEEEYDRRRRAGRRGGGSSRDEFYRDEFYRDESFRDEGFRSGGGEAFRDEAPRPRPPRGRSREARREASEARVLSVLAEARVQDQILRSGGLSMDDDPLERASMDRQLSAQQAPGPVKTTQAPSSPPVSGGERHLQSIFTTGVSALHEMAGINATALQESLRNLHERTVNGTAWGLDRLRRAFGWGQGEGGAQRRFVILLYVPLPILRQYLHLGLRIPRLLWFAPAAATAASAESLRSRFLAEAVRTCIQNAPTTTLQMACRQIHALVVNGNEGGELPGGARRRSLRRTMLGLDEAKISLDRGPESLHRLLGSMKHESGHGGGGATWSEEMLEEGGVWGEAYWEWPGAEEDSIAGAPGTQGEAGADRPASERRAPPPLALADE